MGTEKANEDHANNRFTTKRLLLFIAGIFFAAPLVIAGSIAVWIWLDDPTPVSELLDQDAMAIMDEYDGSMPEDPDAPSVLVLGTPHFQQDDFGFNDDEFDRVVRELAAFEPDLVAVEYLPADWPSGQGRDYRPGFDLVAYARAWGMSQEKAREIVDNAAADPIATGDPCELGKAHFLIRDYANAHYQWDRGDCAEIVEHNDELHDWWRRRHESEHALIGHPVAKANDLEQIVSIDYQGDAAEWFLFTKGPELLLRGQIRDAWNALPEVNPRTRELQGHQDEHNDTLAGLLRFLNSPEQIGLQYWVYEQRLPDIETDNIGQRQTDNYWGRNEEMFRRLDEAVAARDAERVLVITGAGHKYFLDELVRDAGYRWIDPREWLPPPEES